MPSPKPRPPRGSGVESRVYRQRFIVPFQYEVHFTRGVFRSENPLLARVLDPEGSGRRRRVFAVVDRGVAEAHPGLLRAIHEYFHERQERLELAGAPRVVPGGEGVKSDWTLVEELMVEIGNLHLDRQSYVLAIGGGSVLDMAGFVAALVHRGLRLVRMPTTVLSQNDAGVGVKNGMNEHGQKNFLGTFAPPYAVIDDFDFLDTLSDEDWRGGVAESFKVAAIKDRAFFDDLCRYARRVRERDRSAMEEIVRRTAILHLEHIAGSGDPFEMGTARPLDFGHWSAHKLELLSGFRIGHGAAVAVGIALDSYYAARKGYIGMGDFHRLARALKECGFPLWYEELGLRDAGGSLRILEGLEDFREHLGGRLTVTLPGPLGEKVEVHHMDADLIEEGAVALRALESAGGAAASSTAG